MKPKQYWTNTSAKKVYMQTIKLIIMTDIHFVCVNVYICLWLYKIANKIVNSEFLNKFFPSICFPAELK